MILLARMSLTTISSPTVLIPLFAFIYGISNHILKSFNFDHSIFLYLKSGENEVETIILISFLIILIIDYSTSSSRMLHHLKSVKSPFLSTKIRWRNQNFKILKKEDQLCERVKIGKLKV